MPTDLPPDYKPQPPEDAPKPGEGKAPGLVPRPPQGDDAKDGRPSSKPGRRGLPGRPGDVVNPPGWAEPEEPGGDPVGVPQPAGTPTF